MPNGAAALMIFLVTTMSASEGPWVTRGMVVHEDQSRSSQLKGTFDDLAGVNRRVIDRASLLHFVLDQRVLAIEKQYMKFLYLAASELRVTVLDQLVP